MAGQGGASTYSRGMADSGDVVEPVDRKINDILVHIVETTTDDDQRRIARDLMLTLPPVKDWPEDTVRAVYELMSFIEIRKRPQ